MNKRFLFGVGALLLIGGLAVLWFRWYVEPNEHEIVTERYVEQARLKLQGGTASNVPAAARLEPIDPAKPLRLAIGTLGLPTDSDNRQLADLLTAELSGARGLELVERQALDKVLNELGMSLSGVARAKDAVRLGKLLRADWFLLGTPTKTATQKAIVVRVVDARSGVMREVSVFDLGQPMTKSAAEMGRFVRECRQASAGADARVFLAIGAFEDLSVNTRQADLAQQLRAYFTAAYKGSKVTLLERELVSTLLEEVRLDLAGLTDEAAGGGVSRMQSAFWLVDGFYQSYETSGLEVELAANVHRIFGRTERVGLRDKPGDALFQKLKAHLDKSIAESRPILAPTRNSEVRTHLGTGKDLATAATSSFFSLEWAPPYEMLSPAAERSRRHNMQEAIQAFETVLLFEPNHHEAKMYLAALFRRYPLRQVEKAWGYYREIIEDPVRDQWSEQARKALLSSFASQPATVRARWFTAASKETTNAAARDFYRKIAEAVETELVIKDKQNPRSQALAAARLAEGVREWAAIVRTNGPITSTEMFDPFGDFAKGFGTNRAELVEQLALVLPELQRANADVAPHLLAAAVVHQVSTNGPVIAEFAQSLAASTTAMERLVNPKRYFALVSGPVLWWGVEHKQYALITNVLATTERAAAGGYAEKLEDYKKLNLAFAYCALENWQAALDIFQSYSNRPVYVGSRGLWEGAFSTISTSLYTARCREKLGLPVTKDPRQFEMGKSCLCLHDPAYSRQWNAYWVESALFAAEATGLWVAGEGQLVNLDFNLHTNQTIELPASSLASSLSLAKDTIWIGTSDAGLIEYNRVANQCHAITEADGLLMNAISQLYATGDKLWIAYGDRQGRGGLGVMDLRTRKLSSFTRSLGQDPASLRSNFHNQGDEPADRPPRQKLNALLVWKDESWFIPQSVWSHHLRRFRVRENLWDGFAEPGHCSSLLVGEDELYVAQNESGRKDLPGLGVAVRNLRNGAWRRLALADNLVGGTISAMTLDGKDLWVGGLGFIARLDRESGQTRAFSYVSAASVDHLEIAGGCLWAKFDKHLYRATLKDIPL